MPKIIQLVPCTTGQWAARAYAQGPDRAPWETPVQPGLCAAIALCEPVAMWALDDAGEVLPLTPADLDHWGHHGWPQTGRTRIADDEDTARAHASNLLREHLLTILETTGGHDVVLCEPEGLRTVEANHDDAACSRCRP